MSGSESGPQSSPPQSPHDALAAVAQKPKSPTPGAKRIASQEMPDEQTSLLGGSARNHTPVMPSLRHAVNNTTGDLDGLGDGGGHTQHISLANQVFDSLDFEPVENLVLEEERQKRGGDVTPPRWKLWLIIVIIGVLTGLVAFGIDQGIKGLNRLKLAAVTHFMHTNRTNTTDGESGDPKTEMSFAAPYFIYVLINLVYVSIAAALVIFGEPMAKGSGIGEIKCYLNGIRLFRVVRAKTLVCKAVGILFSVASGLPCGKEGPMIHSGAAIASGVATGKSSKMHCDTGLFKEFRSDMEKRNFVTAGAAAGVGAAFGAPVGGVLFAVEEVGTFWKIEVTVMVFICASITPWVLQLLQFFVNGADGAQGSVKGLIDFGHVGGGYHYSWLPFCALLGLLGGGFGAFFIWSNLHLTRLRKKIIKHRWHKFVEVLVISALVSTVLITLVLRGYECVPISTIQTNGYVMNRIETYGCEEGYYNDMATYFLPGLEESISLLVHADASIPYASLLKQFIPYFILTILTYGLNVPSGLFLPTLALGANFGHLYAQLWNKVLPGAQFLSPHAFALFGGTAILAGTVRMTVSVIVIIMEATGNASLFYPLVVIVVSAKFFGDLFTHGIYDAHIHFAKIPLIEPELENPKWNLMVASEAMNPNIVKLACSPSVGQLVSLLKACPHHNAICLVDATGGIRGLLLRRTALILVDRRAWEKDLHFGDFVKSAREREFLRVKKYHIFQRVSPEDSQKAIDLLRYADQWPLCFPTTTPLPRIHRAFRHLGLRHIVIVDDRRRPMGLIGRKQLCHLVAETEDTVQTFQKSALPRNNSKLFGSTHELTNSPFASALVQGRTGGNLASPISLDNQPMISGDGDEDQEEWDEGYAKGVH